jgi:SHS2 domain-containing protein
MATSDREGPEMSYWWVPHTAEMQMEIEAGTEEAVYVDALRALGELLADDVDGERVRRDVVVGGHERAALLVGWLEELVFLAETEGLVPEDVERIELFEHRLVAMVRCRRGRPRHLVKSHLPSAGVRARRWRLPCDGGARCLTSQRPAFAAFTGSMRWCGSSRRRHERTCGCRRGCSRTGS